MDALFLLIGLSFLFVLLIGAVLYWAIFSGQFENIEENSWFILEDKNVVQDEKPVEKPKVMTHTDIYKNSSQVDVVVRGNN